MSVLLEGNGLSVRHGKHQALAPCDVAISRGEILGVYGPNGAGKSTLLQALSCLHEHAGGDVLFEGQRVGSELSLLEYRRRTAVVFQDVLLLRGSVLDNVALGLRLRGIPRHERERRARRWLERLHIAHLAGRPARGISGGEAQRVSLARAFVLEPDVLFLDEPFAAVDAPTRARLLDELSEILADSGAAAVFVTHDPAEIVTVCDRALILDAGHVLHEGPAAEAFRFPRSRRIAEITGAPNLVVATARETTGDGTWLDWDGDTFRVEPLDVAPGTQVTVLLLPDRLEAHLPPMPVPEGAIVGTIVRVTEHLGARSVTVRLRNGHRVQARLAPNLDPTVGTTAIVLPTAEATWRIEPPATRREAGPSAASTAR